ncbi:hypothetical protein V6N13_038926 [Hibiscus sabdariffa]
MVLGNSLVDDLAMQVVASPRVQFVSIQDIPESIVSKEKELEMQRDDLASKPENIREGIKEAWRALPFGTALHQGRQSVG